MKNFLQKINNSKGFVILFAVIFSAILLAVSLGVANVSFKEISFTTSARSSNNSFIAADTGVECALYNNKIGKFFIPTSEKPQQTISCAGKTDISLAYTEINSQPTWDFVIPPEAGNPAQPHCSIVRVTKDNNKYYDKLDIIAKGYNTGSTTCTGFNRVERQLNVSYTTGAIVAADDFEEASEDKALKNHTPSGVNAGTAWAVHSGQQDAVIDKFASDNLTDNFPIGGQSRYKMTNDLKSDQMDVEANFTLSAQQGDIVYFGLIGRLTADSSSDGIIAYYSNNYGSGGGHWILQADTLSQVVPENWTSVYGNNSVNVKLEIRSKVTKLYVNGVEKASLTTSKFFGQNYAGILLGSETGQAGQITVDDYISIGF